MTMINLTPHVINVIGNCRHGRVTSDTDVEEQNCSCCKSFPPSGEVARVSVETCQVPSIGGIDIFSTVYGPVEGLPEEREGVWLIVSLVVKQASPDRKDLLSPGALVRNAEGQPIGCQGLTNNS